MNYEIFDQGFSSLLTVTNSIGLQEEIHYREDGHRLPDGAPYPTIPYVIWYIMWSGNQQLLIETSYTFSDFNFLGYGGFNGWGDGKDNSYSVPADYEYYLIV